MDAIKCCLGACVDVSVDVDVGESMLNEGWVRSVDKVWIHVWIHVWMHVWPVDVRMRRVSVDTGVDGPMQLWERAKH